MGLETFASLAAFCGEFIATPRAIGSLIPSSGWLARHIARQVPATDDGYVIELGAGTGAITRALEQELSNPERLVCVERSATLVGMLRRHFPERCIIEGDAGQLGELLRSQLGADMQVSHIVSSLPLRSLAPPLVAAISQEGQRLLPDSGRYIQFTYHIGDPGDSAPPGFRRLGTSRVWGNLPPARVDVFTPDRSQTADLASAA